jgi:hypothetical protein
MGTDMLAENPTEPPSLGAPFEGSRSGLVVGFVCDQGIGKSQERVRDSRLDGFALSHEHFFGVLRLLEK